MELIQLLMFTILREKYESMINPELGYVIMILETKVEKMGKVIAGDGGTYHRVEFTALTFSPKLQEIVRGEIVEGFFDEPSMLITLPCCTVTARLHASGQSSGHAVSMTDAGPRRIGSAFLATPVR